MKTHAEIAKALRDAMTEHHVSQVKLRGQAGISQRTLTNVLSGHEDFKVSTLLALADRLGLELLIVPKEATRAVSAGQVTPPVVKSRIEQALERIRRRQQKAEGEGNT